jgi:UDP-glucose 4-epimerase
MRQILEGKPLTIYGDGSQVREFTYIGDVIPYIARSYRQEFKYGRTYNLGVGTRVSIEVLAEMVCETVGKSHHWEFLPPRHEVANSYPSTALFSRQFNPHSAVTMDEGLRIMWEWARQTPRMKSKLPEIEVEKGLYPYWKELL